MKYKIQYLMLLLIMLHLFSVTIRSQPIVLQKPDLALEERFPNLSFSFPIDFQVPDDNSNRIFVAEQGGKLKVFNNSDSIESYKVILDLQSKISSGGERGLLGLALHPNFSEDNRIFVDYTSLSGSTIIASYTYSGNANQVSLVSEEIILEIDQPYANHNAGGIAFGMDGFLYITLGDGGSGGDPHGNGQDKTTLLGSILRIDIDRKENGKNYAIPTSNPFHGNSDGFKEEIFAYGFRNPFRISADKISGRIWVGDVGQSAFEEIDLVKGGKNYGWNVMEGNSCYSSASCNSDPFELPVFDYGRIDGKSVIGGYEYHGNDIPSLQGKYVFGDYYTGNIWTIEYDGIHKTNVTKIISESGYNPSAFGIDQNNELYFLDHQQGKIIKFIEDGVNSSKSTSQNKTGLNNTNPTTFGFEIVSITVSLVILRLIGKNMY